jgi:hypothetical protein
MTEPLSLSLTVAQDNVVLGSRLGYSQLTRLQPRCVVSGVKKWEVAFIILYIHLAISGVYIHLAISGVYKEQAACGPSYCVTQSAARFLNYL